MYPILHQMLWDFFAPVKQENDSHVSKRFAVASVERRLSEGDKRGDINLLHFGGCNVWSTIYVEKCLCFI